MVRKGGILVGECPKGFPLDLAEDLLRKSIPESRGTIQQIPYRRWAYYMGAIYLAVSSDGGRTWHAFPNGHPKDEPPRTILRQLMERAEALGEGKLLCDWLRKRWT